MNYLAQVLTRAFLATALLAATIAAQEAGTRRALLIGINDYQAASMPDLRGALNDVERMSRLLQTRFGFHKTNIRTLTDNGATRARILHALRKIVAETGAKDSLYIHFSGHGSQVKDLNGDEKDDEMDETLVPHDGRTAKVPDIVDDELDAILASLRSQSCVVVLDSCHSGTGTRQGIESRHIRFRSIPPESEERLALYRALSVQRRGVVPAELNYVLLTGAARHQSALDGPVDGTLHGFFTHGLAHALSTSKTKTSLRQVFDEIVREYRRIQEQLGLFAIPSPQLECKKSRLASPLLVAASDRPRRPFALVRETGNTNEVTLRNAAAIGANKGSRWAIYGKNERSFAPGSALALGKVQEVSGRDAFVKLSWRGRKALEGGRAILVSPAGRRRVPLRVLGANNQTRQRTASQLYQRFGRCRVVGSNEFARFVVQVDGDRHRLFGADGIQPITEVSGRDAVQEIANVISRSAVSADLLSLNNPASGMGLSVGVARSERAGGHIATRGGQSRGIKLVANTRPAHYRIRRAGEPRDHRNSLRLNVKVEQNCYVTIVDVDSEGGINLLFPNAVSERVGYLPNGYLRAGDRVTIPDSIAEDNQAQFWFDYAEPAGLDTIRVFACADLATARLIRRSMRNLQEAPRQLGDAETEFADPRQALIETLRSQLANVSTRGIKLVPGIKITKNRPRPASQRPNNPRPEHAASTNHNPDWTAASVAIRVQRR